MNQLTLTHPPSPGELARDKRYTPRWVTELLWERCPPPRDAIIVDPACGCGAILAVASSRGHMTYGVDIDPDACLVARAHGRIQCADWRRCADDYRARNLEAVAAGRLRGAVDQRPQMPMVAIVTNPPYSQGAQWFARALAFPWVAALLRLNHLGSATWAPFWRTHPPQHLVVLGGRRPSFTADGRTDASEYMWAIWDSARRCGELARIEVA